MRSQLIFGAMTNVPNRFQLVKVTAKATRELHKPGSRIQDTMNKVLAHFRHANPVAELRRHSGAKTRLFTDRNHRSTRVSQSHRKPQVNTGDNRLQVVEFVLKSTSTGSPQQIQH
jgi:hypothetical protein